MIFQRPLVRRAVSVRSIQHLWTTATPVTTAKVNQKAWKPLATALVAGGVAAVAMTTAWTDAARAEADEEDDEHAFVNWSASHECRPREFHVPETVGDVELLLQTYHKKQQKLRCMGAGVSPNGLGFSGTNKGGGHQALMSMALFDKILDVDYENLQVTVEAGIIVGELLDKLREFGMTMQNVASIRDQQVGGITQAGCHGTGAAIPPIDDQVVEMEIVTPAKGCMVLSKTQNPDLFALAKCGLGSLGVVTKLKLQCVPKHHLVEKTTVMTVDEIRRHHTQWLYEFQHLRYMWIPNTDAVIVVQCKRVTEEEARLGVEKYPPPSYTNDEQLEQPRRLYLELAQGQPDPDYHSWNFTKLRDKLLAFDPLNKDLVVRVNQVEKEFWKRSEGYRVGLSDDIIGFDCGGQQLVQEVAFPTAGTLDLDFVETLLKRLDESGIPAPSPIEQRWTSPSASLMSPAASSNPWQLFSWVGIIMYLPTSDSATRSAIWDRFFDYHALYRDVMEPFGATEHWAKIEWPSDAEEREKMRQRLRRRYPIEKFKKARDEVDPHHILSNDIIDELCA
ncbi:hypothetical protein Poli38472_002035 [Pythium oligandrum]|uniref:FAD-binding PCMH-type domain-containing protein n=1 Tax=Pythium oligandrum TaxID=41045 RepID=A0A8K1CHE4_PYTOL|nr:hypothetical protein Poli38472_002035 [Pythium oligandrum]|eukprot:TMW63094.1 hypothetical protein Poli38472_002035 [Pythium oligandrum]